MYRKTKKTCDIYLLISVNCVTIQMCLILAKKKRHTHKIFKTFLLLVKYFKCFMSFAKSELVINLLLFF